MGLEGMTNEEMLELVNMHHRAMSKPGDVTNEPKYVKDVNVAEGQPLGGLRNPQRSRGTGGWEQQRCDPMSWQQIKQEGSSKAFQRVLDRLGGTNSP